VKYSGEEGKLVFLTISSPLLPKAFVGRAPKLLACVRAHIRPFRKRGFKTRGMTEFLIYY
ncbi:MAG TPA: hypothetical protein VNI77_00925, partial [Nitrososphaera sp.]|nr:hypothetical protein [Nitrososphaera sp.]